MVLRKVHEVPEVLLKVGEAGVEDGGGLDLRQHHPRQGHGAHTTQAGTATNLEHCLVHWKIAGSEPYWQTAEHVLQIPG